MTRWCGASARLGGLALCGVLASGTRAPAQPAPSGQSGPAGQAPLSEPGLHDRFLDWISTGIELAGIAIIALGAVAATVHFAAQLRRGRAFDDSYHQFRANLGRGILIGLEFLVAADIVGTVAVDPTFQNLGVLALIVVVRTFLSFTLEVEIEGRWPWQRGQPIQRPDRSPPS